MMLRQTRLEKGNQKLRASKKSTLRMRNLPFFRSGWGHASITKVKVEEARILTRVVADTLVVA
jgi:hypothetical protein